MNEEGPKLYDNKPKKARLIKVEGPPLSEQLSSSMASKPSSSQSPLSPPPKESFVRRHKFIVPLVLAVNLSVGAYLFMRTKKKDTGAVEAAIPDVPKAPAGSVVAAVPVTETTQSPPAPVKLPVPEDQQRQLFKWLLDEKRKLKPRDPQEKQRLDEEKAILKQFIRAKSIPSL